MRFYFLFLFILSISWSCNQPETAKPVSYTGPLREMENVEMLYTEKQIIKVKLQAKKIFEFQNGDQEFPEGLYLEFYDATGRLTSTLQANTAFFFKAEEKWRGRGKVEVKNVAKNEQLITEELFWKPNTKRIFTDKFVTIKQQTEVLYGTGLDAAQDLSDYTISKPEGEFDVTEN
ncbi:MAG: LPS export ABC transporter periplasmic protein LptC [Bacteroidota bacterium]